MVPRFALARPASVPEALAAFAAADGDGAYLAGGTELLQVMKMGFAQVGTLIDLKRLPELQGIRETADGGLSIGAAVTHREIERSAVVARRLPGLALLERHVANVRVRNAGTIGGNLAFAEPHSDPATFLLACDATVRLVGAAGERTLPIDGFSTGPLLTAREPDEIIVAVEVPGRAAGEGRGYAKIAFFERPAASVAVRLIIDDGVVMHATVVVGSMTDVPVVVPGVGTALAGVGAEPDVLVEQCRAASRAFGTLEVARDHNGSPDYKRHLAGVLLARAALAAREEALAHA